MTKKRVLIWAGLGLVWGLHAGPSGAAPFVPASDAQILQSLPARASDPRAQKLQALRKAWRKQPVALDTAVPLAQAYFEAVAAEGDPRYIGYAQAALAPWWTLSAPPIPVRVLRAKLGQFDHRFDAALADLDAALLLEPGNAEAWSWRAAIHMVQANYVQARISCDKLAPLAPPLIAAACRAQIDTTTGLDEAGAASLRAALQANPNADPAQRLWALTRLAETEERRGAYAAAEAAFTQALALGLNDIYLQAAYADFLLDRNRPAEVLVLLKDRGRADVLLLRQALAAQALGAPGSSNLATELARELAARFDAARLRGDTTHRKEESRYLLALGGPSQQARALELAGSNFAEQREPADARILLQAAVASRQPAAAAPALQWLASSKINSVVLAALAAQLKGNP